MMGGRLRILMVTTYFHPIVGGTEQQALALAKRLVQDGHAVTVATCWFPSLKRFERMDGIPVHRVILPFGRGALYALSYLSSLMAFLVQRRHEYDLIHAHALFLDAFAAGMMRRRLRKPVVVKAACGGGFGDVARLARVPGGALIRSRLLAVDRVVVTSRQVRDELLAYRVPHARIVEIPNGVETGRFHPLQEREGLRTALGVRGEVVCFVGRLTPQKGVDVLLESWTTVTSNYPDATLLIVGKGPQEEELKRVVERLQLGDGVLFCGEQHDVLPYLQAADLFVLPSRAEGMSNALLEAMACGLPCVVTRIGGNVDLIQDGENGSLVEPEDSHQLAEVIVRHLQEPPWSSRLGAAGRGTIEAGYTMTRVTNCYLELYRELMRGTLN